MVSRYLTSRTSSMRPPFSAIEPTSSGVSKVTRGEAASASLRLRICAAAGSADGAPGAPGAVDWLAGVCGVPDWLVVCRGDCRVVGREIIAVPAKPPPAATRAGVASLRVDFRL